MKSVEDTERPLIVWKESLRRWKSLRCSIRTLVLYGNQKLFIVFIRHCHWAQSWTLHPISSRSILILSSYMHVGFLTEALFDFVILHNYATRLPKSFPLIWSVIIFREKCELWNSSSYNFDHPPIISCLTRLNIHLSSLFSNALCV